MILVKVYLVALCWWAHRLWHLAMLIPVCTLIEPLLSSFPLGAILFTKSCQDTNHSPVIYYFFHFWFLVLHQDSYKLRFPNHSSATIATLWQPSPAGHHHQPYLSATVFQIPYLLTIISSIRGKFFYFLFLNLLSFLRIFCFIKMQECYSFEIWQNYCKANQKWKLYSWVVDLRYTYPKIKSDMQESLNQTAC